LFRRKGGGSSSSALFAAFTLGLSASGGVILNLARGDAADHNG
jgi:hypothetical protein